MYNAVYDFLTADLELPRIYGKKWTPEMGDKRMYSAVSAGNISIEPCGPFANINYAEPDFRAIFFGVTFNPYESAAASAEEMDRRGIWHTEPARFMSVTDQELPGDNLGVGFIDLSENKANWAVQDSAGLVLECRGGGPLGIVRVEEIHIGYSDEANLNKWKKFLKPARETEEGLYRFVDKSPALRFYKNDIREVLAIIIRVSSLEKATRYLSENNMLGAVSGGHLEISRGKSFGLRIIFKE